MHESESNIAYIGVDPGKQGFITLLKDGVFSFFSMPYHKVGTGEFSKSGKEKTKTAFHIEGIIDLCFKIRNETRDHQLKVAIEKVGGRGGWSATNNFEFGYIAGIQRMIFMMLNANILMVRPQKWQSFMRQGYPEIKKSSSTGKTMISDPKAIAKMIVEKEYPDIDFRKTERSKNIDDNKIDSFLICMYLYRINNK